MGRCRCSKKYNNLNMKNEFSSITNDENTIAVFTGEGLKVVSLSQQEKELEQVVPPPVYISENDLCLNISTNPFKSNLMYLCKSGHRKPKAKVPKSNFDFSFLNSKENKKEIAQHLSFMPYSKLFKISVSVICASCSSSHHNYFEQNLAKIYVPPLISGVLSGQSELNETKCLAVPDEGQELCLKIPVSQEYVSSEKERANGNSSNIAILEDTDQELKKIKSSLSVIEGQLIYEHGLRTFGILRVLWNKNKN